MESLMPFSWISSFVMLSKPFSVLSKPRPSAQMAARVLVEEGVVVEDALVVDGRVVSDERTFAELRRALVHCDHLFKEVLVLLRLDFDGPAAFKAHGEVSMSSP